MSYYMINTNMPSDSRAETEEGFKGYQSPENRGHAFSRTMQSKYRQVEENVLVLHHQCYGDTPWDGGAACSACEKVVQFSICYARSCHTVRSVYQGQTKRKGDTATIHHAALDFSSLAISYKESRKEKSSAARWIVAVSPFLKRNGSGVS
ncbi:hypothetical protein XELAEV_18009237mg, partial [Xenopus laevis]